VPDAAGQRCSACGFSWDWGADDAIGMVAESPELFAQAVAHLGDVAADDRPALAVHLWRMVDALRFGAERLWAITLDPGAPPPRYDLDAAAGLRPDAGASVVVGLHAYRQAAAQWVDAARDATAAVPTDQGRLGGEGPGDVVADVVRDGAHDAQHHLLELERLVRPRPATVFVAAGAPHPSPAPPAATAVAPLFDEYLMVDWSAASAPRTGRDSVWTAHGSWADGTLRTADPSNPATRAAAAAEIHAVVARCLAAGRRLLVGVDFPLAYPAGLTRMFPAVFGAGPPWRALWRTLADRIEDKADNANNRWEVAAALNRDTGHRLFWGCPSGEANAYLGTKDRPLPGLAEREPALARFRLTERRAQGVGGSIQSVWKLAYAGSVGSQALLGIPHLEALRSHFGGDVAIWPLETGLAPALTPVTVTEIWPTVFPTDWSRHPVRDAAQVLEVVARVAGADTAGELAAWLAPAIEPASAERVAEEGWILGVT